MGRTVVCEALVLGLTSSGSPRTDPRLDRCWLGPHTPCRFSENRQHPQKAAIVCGEWGFLLGWP